MTAARWAQQKNEPAGWGTGTLPSVEYPVPPARRRARVDRRLRLRAAFARPADIRRRTNARSTSILDQTAIALDRALLAREAVNAAAMQENEKVRDALLASLSHDLRTPLSAIAGAATSLRALGDKMSADGTASNS